MIGISQVPQTVKGATLTNAVPFTGEVLNGHYLPGSFTPYAASNALPAPCFFSSSLCKAFPSASSAVVSPVEVLSPLGCDWCGAVCGSASFCSASCRRSFEQMAPAVLRSDVPDYDFVDAMAEDEF